MQQGCAGASIGGMGQRANYVIVDPPAEGGYELYYSHWAANRVPQDLFWGPEHALTFIRGQRPVPAKQWLDTVWAEGGALVDPERQTLLLFGGDDMDRELGLRRVYLRLVQPLWPGWNVRWADGELVELADYVGVDEEHVLVAPTLPDDPRLCLSDVGDDWYDTAISIRWEDGLLNAWGSPDSINEVLALGNELVDQAHALRGGPTRVPPKPKSSPRAGVHIDVGAGRVHVWSLVEGAAAQWLLRTRWGPWHAEWLGDQWERQLELAEGRFAFPVPTDAEFLDVLVTRLSNHRHVGGVDALLLSHEIHGDGADGAVNPWVLRDDNVPADEAARDSILASAVASYGA